jgi:hypothetical protein
VRVLKTMLHFFGRCLASMGMFACCVKRMHARDEGFDLGPGSRAVHSVLCNHVHACEGTASCAYSDDSEAQGVFLSSTTTTSP